MLRGSTSDVSAAGILESQSQRKLLFKSPLGSSWLVHLPGEVCPHGGPFAGDDAVDTGIAEGPVGSELVTAQDTVEFGAQALDAAAALVIQEVGTKLHGDAPQVFEGVGQQEKLALRIDSGALGAFTIPGGADLDAAVGDVDVHVRGHAEGTAVRVEHRERQHRTLSLQVEAALDLGVHFVGR